MIIMEVRKRYAVKNTFFYFGGKYSLLKKLENCLQSYTIYLLSFSFFFFPLFVNRN